MGTTEQCRFASLAIRISHAQSKLPVIAGAIDALIADALDTREGEAPIREGEAPAEPRSNLAARPE